MGREGSRHLILRWPDQAVDNPLMLERQGTLSSWVKFSLVLFLSLFTRLFLIPSGYFAKPQRFIESVTIMR
jgi:hypothetical protein